MKEGHRLADQLGDPATTALITHSSGVLAVYSGDLPLAVTCFDNTLEPFRAQNNLPMLTASLLGLAISCGLLGDAERALRCHEEVLAITQPLGDLPIVDGRCGQPVWPFGATASTLGRRSTRRKVSEWRAA